MGKSKGKAKAAAVPKCTCDHPFKCDCGNRPERPSKGHKWDPQAQAWGGKGHKQKGASGQTASIGQADKVTSVGQTAIKQWQKLPSQLLGDLMRKNAKALGKGLPIYKPANNKSGGKGYRYRLIIPDTSKKGATNRSDHDIVLLPALSVPNEEQAKEEAALLGLLYLFPKLPHERTLPDPYRTTYLAALENSKATANNDSNNATTNAASSINTNASKSKGGATSNTKLMANIPSFNKKTDSKSSSTGAPVILTKAQLNEARKEHQRTVQARIRKHEAIRNANKPMEVFMSATFRSRIECLLSGTVFEEMNEDDDVDSNEEDDDLEDVAKSYVLQRLVFEGFKLSHVRKAYREVKKKGELSSIGDNSDENIDKVYECVLQFLLVHLNEDQLPLGFDPRGGTLDVVSGSLGTKKNTTKDKDTKKYNAVILQLATLFGLRPEESYAIFTTQQQESTARSVFWKVLCDAAPIPSERRVCDKSVNNLSDEDKERNMEAASNECEALGAIFEAKEFSIAKDSNTTSVSIGIPFDSTKLCLEIHYKDGLYPDLLPEVFLTSKDPNNDNKNYQQGGTLHLQIVRFLSELSPGQECIFELFGYVQTLLQDAGENDPCLLLSKLSLNEEAESNPIKSTNASKSQNKESDSGKRQRRQLKTLLRRPREKSSFFSIAPSKTHPAEDHPKLPVLMDRARKSLPAFKIRDEILSLLKQASASGRVSLVTGETGSGKSTQIPAYILEDDPVGSKIIVAQPRRLAATGVATRVAAERNEEVGKGSVGYVVRGDSKTCDRTRLLFLTTGVLLRQLQSENALDNISHIVIDEVHERHLDTDVLLAILKKVLPSYPKLHVVLMSATMDSDRMAAYWSSKEVTNIPKIHIPGRTFPVQDFMLEDVLQMTGYIPPKNGKKKQQHSRGGKYQIQPSLVDDEFDEGDDASAIPIKSSPEECVVPLEERLKRMNEKEIDYDLIAVLIKTLLRTKDDDGSVLVFLPGAGEIDRASNAIQNILRGFAITILPLHGGLQPEKQQQVFVPAKKGYTKIILSTNVAETSITIPDCTLVVDTCKEKQSSFDPVNRMPLLLETFASRDSLKQRRGRAGRVRPGKCYKLVSSSFYGKLPEHGEPEIRRCSLDQTILSLLFLGLEDGSGNFLRLLLDPPSDEAVKSAFYSLEQIGALSQNGNTSNLTPLGTHLAGIPAPPTVGKLLVMGSLLGCRNISIAVASGMSIGRSPFLRINSPHHRNGKELNGDTDQQKDERNDDILRERADLFKTVGNSDHAMLGKIFILWQSCNGAAERRRLCDRFGLAFNSMREMAQVAKQLDSSLTTSGFTESYDSNKNENSWRVVRSVIVSALSPTQIVRVQRPTTKYTETVEGAVAKDGVSKELKFFIREGNDADPIVDVSEDGEKRRNFNGEKRVFIHPSSNNFAVGSYSCPWLVYHRLVQTSKAFISDSTECNAYAMLMFGGAMDVQASKGLIILNNWVQLSANPRIGSLIGRLRERVDDLLEKKVADPSLDITSSTELTLITDLLKRDGC